MAEVKKTKKKNKVASLLLALALILTCGVAGTIAQYQKSFNGTATANVAKFDVSQTGINSNTVNLFDNVLDTEAGTGNYSEADVASGKIAPGTVGYVELSVTNKSEVSIDYSFGLKKAYSAGLSAGTAGNGWEVNYGKSDGSNTTTTTGEIPLEFALYTGNTELGDTTGAVTASQKGQAINGITSWSSLNNLISADNSATGSNKKLSGTINVGTSTAQKVYLCWRWAYTDGNKDGSSQEQLAYTNRNALDTAIGEDMASSNKTINPKLEVTLTASQKN